MESNGKIKKNDRKLGNTKSLTRFETYQLPNNFLLLNMVSLKQLLVHLLRTEILFNFAISLVH